MKKILITISLFAISVLTAQVQAAEYDIDGSHSAIQFKIKHLGYSWLLGGFNKFDGQISYDESKPRESKVTVSIDTASIDSNFAARDKHLRSKDFLDVSNYPTAKFVSTSFENLDKTNAILKGDLTLHGITKNITIVLKHVGHGQDPWGGYRRGFAGSTTLALKDYGITTDLGPASRNVELYLAIEGIHRK